MMLDSKAVSKRREKYLKVLIIYVQEYWKNTNIIALRKERQMPVLKNQSHFEIKWDLQKKTQ